MERRLHPLSWLFVLLTQIRPFVVPLLAFLVLGRGASWELWGALGAVGFAAHAFVYSIAFRYRIGDGELVVREGVLWRTVRHVPFSRAQNIVQNRNVLHRLFGVTELRLESAGGSKPEAVMNVITNEEAARLIAILRGEAVTTASVEEGEAADTRLALGPGELLRLGLITNRGWVLVGALMAVLWQSEELGEPWSRDGVRQGVRAGAKALSQITDGLSVRVQDPLSWLLFALAFVLLVKVLSIAMAFITFHRFRLMRVGDRIATEGGLFTLRLASARLEKIQRLIVSEGWWARRIGRRTLECEIATGRQDGDPDERARLRWLAPIAPPADIDALVRDVQSGAGLEQARWRPLHPQAWKRMARSTALVAVAPTLGLSISISPWILLAWPVAVLIGIVYARGWARFARYAIDGDTLGYRAGWITRRWTCARIADLQTISVSCSPLDRRAGMADLALDTAGAGTTAFALTIPYLPIEQAQHLAAELRLAVAARRACPPIQGRAST